MKDVYKEAIKYIKTHNIGIEDCISDDLHLNYDEFSLNNFLSEDDKNTYLRMIFISVKINECNGDVLKYLLKSESKDKDVLFVLFNLIKKLLAKNLVCDEELEIIQKCKNYWCYKFVRGVLVQIFTMMSTSKHYYEVLSLEFIVRYSLWTKSAFLTKSYLNMNPVLDNTIFSKYGFDKDHNTRYNVFLIVKFLGTMNTMNYKYLRKTLMMLDLEMYKYLPTKYTELGLTNLISIINEYEGASNRKGVLKDYLQQLIPFDIPFLRSSNNTSWAYNHSLVIRKAFLQSIQSPELLYKFMRCNQLSEDLDLVDMIVEKVKEIYEMFNSEIRLSFNNLIKSCVVSIFSYRRLLGLKLLMATKNKNNISQIILVEAIFDKSQLVRNYARTFHDLIHFTSEDIEQILLSRKYRNLDLLFTYIQDKTIDMKNLVKIAKEKVLDYLENRSFELCHNLLRFLILFSIDHSRVLIDQIKTKLLKKEQQTPNDKRLIKEVCHYYYMNKDVDSLIDVLLRIADLGVILTINKQLKDLKVNLPEDKVVELIDNTKYNDNWIRKSAGLGVLFRSISFQNKRSAFHVVINNLETHMECNKTECENILYHNYSILLSIIEDFTITIDLLDLCFNGIKSTSWIVKNNSIRLYKVVYDKSENIEMNDELRDYIFERLENEFYSQTLQNNNMFNDTIFCLVLCFRKYESINTREAELLTTIKQSKRFILPDTDNDTSNNLNYIFEMKDTNEKQDLSSFLKTKQYLLLKKWLLVFVSEDEEQKLILLESVFSIFDFTHEKIIFEIIKTVNEQDKIDTLLEDISPYNQSYDTSYIHFLCNELTNK